MARSSWLVARAGSWRLAAGSWKLNSGTRVPCGGRESLVPVDELDGRDEISQRIRGVRAIDDGSNAVTLGCANCKESLGSHGCTQSD